jgi:hypothetical protein
MTGDDSCLLNGEDALNALLEWLDSINHVHTRRGIVYAAEVRKAVSQFPGVAPLEAADPCDRQPLCIRKKGHPGLCVRKTPCL